MHCTKYLHRPRQTVFNPADFVQAFTEAQADAKYLRLATPFTASAEQCFSNGIHTTLVTHPIEVLPVGSFGYGSNFLGKTKFNNSLGNTGQVITYSETANPAT